MSKQYNYENQGFQPQYQQPPQQQPPNVMQPPAYSTAPPSYATAQGAPPQQFGGPVPRHGYVPTQGAPPQPVGGLVPQHGYAPTQGVPPKPMSGPVPQHGYVTTQGPPPPPAGVQQHAYVTQTTVTARRDPTGLRTAIPELPMALAITYCVINCILPGVGTILAGFSVFCCGNIGQSDSGRVGTFCINFWVGIAQMALVFFFIGWIWSIMWGVAFVAIASEAQRRSTLQTHVTTTTVTANPAVQVPTHQIIPPQQGQVHTTQISYGQPTVQVYQ